MNRLQTEFQRLYAPPGAVIHAGEDAAPLEHEGRTRALVIEMIAPLDWQQLGRAWRGLQDELGLPAPAIAVSGSDAMQLWISVAEPVDTVLAHDWLARVAGRFLAGVPRQRLRLWPQPQGHVAPVPRAQPSGHWSSFVTPDLAPLFSETPWLEMPPSQDGQAGVLAALATATAGEFGAALEALGCGRPAVPAAGAGHGDVASADAGPPAVVVSAVERPTPVLTSGRWTDPRAFLLAVMNDPSVPIAQRLEAARALLAAPADGRS